MFHFKVGMVLLAVAAVAISVQAEDLFPGWIPTTGDSKVLSKNTSIEAGAVILRGGEENGKSMF